MENLTCKGLSAAHRRMLIKCITEEIGSIPEPVEIEFMEPIRRKQYSSLWYGGQIAAIRVHGCVFEVHALGDVYAWLYDKSDRDRGRSCHRAIGIGSIWSITTGGNALSIHRMEFSMI